MHLKVRGSKQTGALTPDPWACSMSSRSHSDEGCDPRAGGSAAAPQGEVSVRLYEGAVGTTRLRTADARAAIDAAQRLDFALELAPAESRHNSGHFRVSGVVPLSEVGPPAAAASRTLAPPRSQPFGLPPPR